jgi:hypothetical protein
MIYLAYGASFPLKIFLKPVRPEASAWSMVAHHHRITGLAVLGRPGELIRRIHAPADLTFSSQMAVWAVERIFDIGAFTALLVTIIFVAKGPRELPFYHNFQRGFSRTACSRARHRRTRGTREGEGIANWVNDAFRISPTSVTRSLRASRVP